jgi:hypothetical protein
MKHKGNQMLAGIFLLLLSAIAVVFSIGFAMLLAEGGRVISPLLGSYQIHPISLGPPIANLILWALFPIPFIMTLEGGLWRLGETLKMRDEALGYKPDNIWSKIAGLLRISDYMKAALFITAFLAFLFLLIHEIHYWPKSISASLIIYAASTLLYFAIRKALKRIAKGVARKFRKGLPTYQLTADGVLIKLFTMASKKHPDPAPVYIRFDEVDELRVFTFTEAQAFLKYNIGPDLDLGRRQVTDTAAYLKGEIPRPSVYTFGSARSDCVFIRGAELFYLIVFDTDDVTDLLEAYRSFKALDRDKADL